MKVSYDEGIASHIGSESCGRIREDAIESVDRGTCGLGIEPRKRFHPECRRLPTFGRQHRSDRHRKIRPDSAWSETPCTHASTSQGGKSPPFGSREIPGLAWADRPSPRRESERRTTAMHRTREVGQAHSTREVPEQGRWCATGGGGDGGKGSGQGEAASANQAHGTQRPVPQGGPAT